MIVANYIGLKPELAHSRTYEDFYKFLGARPKMMGVMARMNTQNTASFITEGLLNIYHNEKSVNKFQPINSLAIDWEIEVDFLKEIEFAAVPVGTGAAGSSITMYFKEGYYQLYDTFKINGSRQQCIVKATPVRKADNFWEYVVQLIDADFSSILDSSACQVGMKTRFLSNIMPEYHEVGFTKYQSNVEKHRQWITEHRNDISLSARYAQMEDQFIKVTSEKEEQIFKLNKAEKDLLDNFQVVKNNHLLQGKTTMDSNGKCTVLTEDGRPLIAGDGIIPQIERFASKYKFAKLNIAVINTMLEQMAQKAVNPTGNTFTIMVNDRLWGQTNSTLASWLKDWGSTPTMLYSKATNSAVKADNALKVGATFVSYEIAGNTVVFMVDRALSKEYPSKAYGICLDLTPDATINQPAVAAFTIKGAEFISSKFPGVGGVDGITSGIVSSPVAGSKLIVAGYSGIVVFAPYKAFVIEEV
jgi:hypothetical protein